MATSTDMDLFDPNNAVRLFRQGETLDNVLKLISESDESLLAVQPDGSSLLHSFSVLGCYEVVKLLWEKGAQPSILKKDDSTLLHSAVRTQDRTQDNERAKILEIFLSSDDRCLGNSMPIDYQNSRGWTALKLAARRNLEQCVEVLLKRGADPDIMDQEMYTPLHNAIFNADIVKLLLSKAKTINSQNEDGETPLSVAATNGLVDSALTLLEGGADPNITNKEGITPLFLAARDGHLELVKALVRYKADVNIRGATQQIGPLHWAAHKEHEEIALFLIENGGDVMSKDSEGRTPLSMASPELATKMTLVAQRINPELSIPSSNSPPMSAEEKAIVACCGGNVRALFSLIQAGVSVNHTNATNKTSLLHMAAYCGQLESVMLLMKLGADWQAVDSDGDTLIHFACMKEVSHGLHDATLDYLLQSPAAKLKDTQNSNGDTPILVATRNFFVPRVKVLLKYKASVSIANKKNELPLHRACGSDKAIEALLHFAEKSTDLNVQDNDGWTPLMYGAKSGSSAVIKYLLQKGADPNVSQTTGFTALYLAAQEEHPSICHLLLEAGGNPHLAGGSQKLTPLHIAAHRHCKPVVQVLIEYGADIHLPDADGDSPLMLADGEELRQAMLFQQAARQAIAGLQDVSIATNNDDLNESNEEPPDDQVTNEPSAGVQLTKQNTFSKEMERENSEDSEGDTIPRSKYQELLNDVRSQAATIAKLQGELESVYHDKEMLLSRNKSLADELKTKEDLISAHHLQHAFHVHRAHAHDVKCPHHHAWWLVESSDYEITDELLNSDSSTTGKFFSVYRGTYRNIPVAVRQVRGVEEWSEEVYRTFYNEVDFISHLQCPWLVQFIGASVDMEIKQCTILTELMSRGSLHCVLHVDKIPLDWNTRIGIVKGVCCGMVFLHSYQMLHRSLIPRNILIGEHFNAKLSDFGVWETKRKSNFFSETGGSQSTSPQVYMAPEAMEHSEFTQAADVYSFGIILCEAATGQKPFADLHVSPVVMVMRLLMGLRPSFNGGVAKEYQSLAESCWHADPNLRPTFKSVHSSLQNM